MSKGKSSLSKGKSYKEIGDFWDTHDLSEFWDKTKEVKFEETRDCFGDIPASQRLNWRLTS